MQFSVFHSARQALSNLKLSDSGQAEQQLSLADLYLAGGTAGVANSMISGPVEHIRIRLQMQPTGTTRLYTGPWDCARQIVSKSGPRGIFKGQSTAVLREFQAYDLYFATFEACVRTIAAANDKRRDDLPTWSIASCGAMSGIAFWLGSCPLDVVKTKLQSDGFGQNQRYRNAWAAAKETWKSGRFKGFFRGLSPTLLRTTISSAGTFAM